MLGYETTVKVTMAEMLHHTRAVVRGTRRALVIGDMPFLTYSTIDEATDNAGRFMQDAGAQAVKIEGGVRSARIVEALVRSGVPVQGHIGWTPQSQHGMGGKVKVQGKSRDAARAVLHDAVAIQDAGAFSIVLELVPEQLAAVITERLQIPTIGIGAGPSCDGQNLVLHDMVGLFDRFTPKFVKRYANCWDIISKALVDFQEDVRKGQFPSAEHSFTMKEDEYQALLQHLAEK
jgi:3-methyl-2-oxobutanoate hydroxymethyltransferase